MKHTWYSYILAQQKLFSVQTLILYNFLYKVYAAFWVSWELLALVIMRWEMLEHGESINMHSNHCTFHIAYREFEIYILTTAKPYDNYYICIFII